MNTGLRAAAVVAAVYGFFLIFAQFAFVEILRSQGVGLFAEKVLLGAMALAGMATGFGVAMRGVSRAGLRAGLVLCSVAGALAAGLGGLVVLLVAAVLTGAGIGAATVSTATLLPRWGGVRWLGLGTGIGYALCNVPWVFASEPRLQAWVGVVFAALGTLAVPEGDGRRGGSEAQGLRSADMAGRPLGGVAAILAFLALVWLDSAAFFIIQHDRELKAGTWGDSMLWRNAALHLGAALVAGWWLGRRPVGPLLAVAWTILAVAALAANDPATRGLAGWGYPIGVSLYSTALVAWPGFLSGAVDMRGRAWRAAGVFAIAGWFGSANGIGMAQTLHQVPLVFVGLAGLTVFVALRGLRAWRGSLAAAGVLGIAWLFAGGPPVSGDAVARGREVYLAEGCIACHSRYVRPDDPEGWGPPTSPDEALGGKPVLIGNRRQGPDLAHVGARRSSAWLREHFIAPRKFVKDSPMPSYAHLFEDGRGEDLIAWLAADQGDALAWRMEKAASWQPSGGASGDGASLFAAHCAVCHGIEGRGDGELAGAFAKAPPDLVRGPFVWTADPASLPRVIRWGVPGTDMPGHEVLEDGEVLALAAWVKSLRR